MTPCEILLVEDNPKDEALTLRAIRKNNFASTVTVVRDGAEALDYLFGERAVSGDLLPDLILLDLKLPKVDGIDVLKRIRAEPQTQLLPIVVLTTSTEERDRLASYRFGANSYIRKPVDFAQFVEAVHQLGLYWLVLNERPPANPRS
jgi:two-component system response regulator